MANNINNISDFNQITMSDYLLSQKTPMSGGRGERNLSLDLGVTDSFLIVCNNGSGERGTSLGSSDGDFNCHAEVFLIHKGKIILGAKQTVGKSTTYGTWGSLDYISAGTNITSNASIDANGIFTYTLSKPDEDGFSAGCEVYTYSIWQLN